MARTAHIVRETSESHIDLELNLDGTGKTDIDTSVPFYNHMMTALGKHSLIDLTIHAHGDTDIDVHHTVEDTAIVFGEALKQALGDKKGIRRLPMPPCRWTRPWPSRGRYLRPPVLRVQWRARRLRILHDRWPLHWLAGSSRHGIHRVSRWHLPAHAGTRRPRSAPCR